MSIAVIDMGTNTFHLMIVEVTGKTFREIHSRREAVKLGKEGINKGYITEAAGKRAVKALISFKKEIIEHKVDQIFATATSAIRNAKNGTTLVEEIFRKTGIAVRVISGNEEAETIYYGVKNALSLGPEKSLVMDIGGGSIEFIICNEDTILWRRSFEIGGQRLVELFHANDRITTLELEKLTNHLEENLKPLLLEVEKQNPKTLVGSSGTFDTLSDIYLAQIKGTKNDKATEFPVTIDSFYETYRQMISRTRAERMEIPGMIEMRVDMIVVAVELIKFVIERCNLQKMRVSAYALKEGVLLKTIHSISKVSSH